jgi:hypothetical protein
MIILLFLLREGKPLFAPKGANPCDNLYLELRLFDTTEQHRTDCCEKGALKETETVARGQTLQLDLW